MNIDAPKSGEPETFIKLTVGPGDGNVDRILYIEEVSLDDILSDDEE